MIKPSSRPNRPFFSSGPCAKRPGWTSSVLDSAILGRSHRSDVCKAKLNQLCDDMRVMLGIPDSYRIGIVPASDTGAVEMAMWNLLGARGVDIFAWESFGKGWVSDAKSHLKLADLRVIEADYGTLPDLSTTDPSRDVVLTWNGTTSGVCVPNGHWIAPDRQGLIIADATSAVFAMEMPWDKLDVVTWSWQKVMGGESAHGMIVLSPQAVERLESYTPPWPLPKIFRLTKGQKLIEGVFQGETINTPSMMCVEDMLDSLAWARAIGGLPQLIARTQANYTAVADWVAQTYWVDFLCANPAHRSPTSICLKLSDQCGIPENQRPKMPKAIADLLAREKVAYDIKGHRDAPAGIRLWGGGTVESADMKALMPWLDWAFATCKKEGTDA